MDYSGRKMFITHDQAMPFSTPFSDNLGNRQLSSPGDEHDVPQKKNDDKNTPETQPGNICIRTTTGSPTEKTPLFLNTLAKSIVTPVTEVPRDTTLNELRPILEEHIVSIISNDTDVKSIIHPTVVKAITATDLALGHLYGELVETSKYIDQLNAREKDLDKNIIITARYWKNRSNIREGRAQNS